MGKKREKDKGSWAVNRERGRRKGKERGKERDKKDKDVWVGLKCLRSSIWGRFLFPSGSQNQGLICFVFQEQQ